MNTSLEVLLEDSTEMRGVLSAFSNARALSAQDGSDRPIKVWL